MWTCSPRSDVRTFHPEAFAFQKSPNPLRPPSSRSSNTQCRVGPLLVNCSVSTRHKFHFADTLQTKNVWLDFLTHLACSFVSVANGLRMNSVHRSHEKCVASWHCTGEFNSACAFFNAALFTHPKTNRWWKRVGGCYGTACCSGPFCSRPPCQSLNVDFQ